MGYGSARTRLPQLDPDQARFLRVSVGVPNSIRIRRDFCADVPDVDAMPWKTMSRVAGSANAQRPVSTLPLTAATGAI